MATLDTVPPGAASGQIVIQYTDRCNASCAQCSMRKENVYQRSALGHMKVDTFGKRYVTTLHMAFNAKKTRAEIPTSSKESCCGNMAIRRL